MTATFSETEFSLSGFLKPDPNDPSDPNYSLSYTDTHATLLALLSKRCGSGVETTIFDRWYESPLPPAERKGLKELRIRTQRRAYVRRVGQSRQSRLYHKRGTCRCCRRPMSNEFLSAAAKGRDFVKALGYKARCRGKFVGSTFRQGAATITVFQI